MPSVCCADNCTNKRRKHDSDTSLSFHRYPLRDPDRLGIWMLLSTQRQDWYPNNHSSLCSDHFAEKWLDRTYQSTRLLSGAVPTIYKFSANQPVKEKPAAKPAKVLDALPKNRKRPSRPSRKPKPRSRTDNPTEIGINSEAIAPEPVEMPPNYEPFEECFVYGTSREIKHELEANVGEDDHDPLDVLAVRHDFQLKPEPPSFDEIREGDDNPIAGDIVCAVKEEFVDRNDVVSSGDPSSNEEHSDRRKCLTSSINIVEGESVLFRQPPVESGVDTDIAEIERFHINKVSQINEPSQDDMALRRNKSPKAVRTLQTIKTSKAKKSLQMKETLKAKKSLRTQKALQIEKSLLVIKPKVIEAYLLKKKQQIQQQPDVIEVIDPEIKVRCDICLKFVVESQQASHKINCIIQWKPYICTNPRCDKRFWDRKLFEKHKLSHNDEKTCKACGVFVDSRLKLRSHIKKHCKGRRPSGMEEDILWPVNCGKAAQVETPPPPPQPPINLSAAPKVPRNVKNKCYKCGVEFSTRLVLDAHKILPCTRRHPNIKRPITIFLT